MKIFKNGLFNNLCKFNRYIYTGNSRDDLVIINSITKIHRAMWFSLNLGKPSLEMSTESKLLHKRLRNQL